MFPRLWKDWFKFIVFKRASTGTIGYLAGTQAVSGNSMAVSCAEFAMTVTITSRLVRVVNADFREGDNDELPRKTEVVDGSCFNQLVTMLCRLIPYLVWYGQSVRVSSHA